MASVACALEPNAVAPSFVACTHKPEPVASMPFTVLHVAGATLLITVPLVPRVCTVPSLLAPPIVVTPIVEPLAAAPLDASAIGFNDVDNELTPVMLVVSDVSCPSPVDIDATPVDKELMPLVATLKPLEVEVDSDDTLLLVVLRPVDSELMPLAAVLKPVEVDVDNADTLLLVVLSPVDSEFTPLCAVLIPVDVEVDSDVTLLLVELKPVDSELMPADVEVDKDDNWLKFTASVGLTPAATLVSVTGVVAPTPPKVTLV
nr:hypothetical protein [Collimonas humicola]